VIDKRVWLLNSRLFCRLEAAGKFRRAQESMGQAASADKPADCDLDDEAVEEIRMITARASRSSMRCLGPG
jgi:hypothetical protein